MKKQFHLTKEGAQDGAHVLVDAGHNRVAQRGPIAERIKSAREFGDLSENAEYTSALQEQVRVESRIAEIEHILQNLEIITKPRGGRLVQLGSIVKLKAGSKIKQFQIVGTVEADPLNGKISDESPIGQALLGRKEGEKVEIHTPVETSTYKIVNIS